MNNHQKKSLLKKLKSYIPSIILLFIFFGCGGDDGGLISSCSAHKPTSAPPREELPTITTVLSTSHVVVMQTDIVSIIVDIDAPSDVTVELFSSSLEDSDGNFNITIGSCTNSNATSSCEEWFITPDANTIPGDYELRIIGINPSVGANRDYATLIITVETNPALNSAPAVISVAGENGVWHVLTRDQSRWSWANGNDESNIFGAAGIRSYFDSEINKVNPFTVDIAARYESPLLWSNISGNATNGLALDSLGDVYTWGENTSALGLQSSLPIPEPRLLPNISNATQVATTLNSSFTLINGEITAWGSNFEGVRGVGNSTNPWTEEFNTVNSIANAIQLAAGDNHVLSLSSEGLIHSWGSNGSGQLGGGSVGAFGVTTATPIPFLTDVIQIAASSNFSLALKDDGTAWAWGDNSQGQAGIDSTETAVSSPTQVVGLSTFREVAALTLNGETFAFAIDESSIGGITQRRVYRWGGGIFAPQLINTQPVSSIGGGYFTDYNCGLVTLADGSQARSGFLWDIRDLFSPIPKLISFFGKNDPTCPNKLFLNALPVEGGTYTTSPDGGQFLEYDTPTEVVITAVANPGWEVDSNNPWSGNEDCSDGVVLVQGGIQCIANFIPANARQLAVQLSGTGSGNVTSQPNGINCGQTCIANFSENATVILTATPDANSTFASWSGTGDCQTPTQIIDNQLTLTVSSDSECIATFDPISTGDFILTVIINGSGEVNSTETPVPSMMCLNSVEESVTCSVAYPVGSSVTLVADIFFPSNTLIVTGCDSFVGPNSDCFVTMDQDKTVTFDISQSPEYDISATIIGNGSIISFASGGEVGVTGRIECPSINCNDTFVVPPNAPTNVVFEAHPDTGSTFVSFGTGQCDSESVTNGIGICNVDLVVGSATARQVDATFQ